MQTRSAGVDEPRLPWTWDGRGGARPPLPAQRRPPAGSCSGGLFSGKSPHQPCMWFRLLTSTRLLFSHLLLSHVMSSRRMTMASTTPHPDYTFRDVAPFPKSRLDSPEACRNQGLHPCPGSAGPLLDTHSWGLSILIY